MQEGPYQSFSLSVVNQLHKIAVYLGIYNNLMHPLSK